MAYQHQGSCASAGDSLELLAFDDEFDPLAVDDSEIDQEWMDDENPYDTIDYPTMRNMPETVHHDPVYSPARQGSATEALQALIVRNPNRRPVLLNIIGLCDVDWKYADHIFKRYPAAKKFNDYRKMYDETAKEYHLE